MRKYLLLAFAIPVIYAAPASMPGVPRYVVLNDNVARGGQPSVEGFRNLAAAGFREVIDLQEKGERSKEEKHIVESLGMKYVNVPMKGMRTPEDKQILKALKALNHEKHGAVFIHCKRGADRTGVVMACYRMEHDGWNNREALQEARDLGMHWYELPFQRYISSYRPHHSGEGLIDSAADKLKGIPDAVTGIFR